MHEMTNIFTKEKTDNAQTITTLEIAEMMNIGHWQVLRKLDGREENGKHIKGYVEILTDNQMVVSDYFSESVYKDASGKENRCYNVTKLGCDFLANKFTGEKGVMESKDLIQENARELASAVCDDIYQYYVLICTFTSPPGRGLLSPDILSLCRMLSPSLN